jgi:DNA gyrase subunit A
MRFTSLGEAMFPESGAERPMAAAFPQLLANGAWAHSGSTLTELTGDAKASGPGDYGPVDYIPLEDLEGGEVLSFIPPHNLGELVRALIHLVDHPAADLAEILNLLPGPDFPTGGVLTRTDSLRSLYETGTGSLSIGSHASVEPGNRGRKLIVVSELPFSISKTKIIEALAGRVQSKDFVWCSDIRDLSPNDHIRIEVEVRRGYDEEKILRELCQSTPLQQTIPFRLVVRVAGSVETKGLLALLRGYLDHRREMLGIRSDSEGNGELRRNLEGLLGFSDSRRTRIV